MTLPSDAPERPGPNRPPPMADLGCVMTEGVERGGMASGSQGSSVQGHAPGGHALRTFPGGVRGRPNRRHLSAFAGMTGAIGLLLLSGCGSFPRWFGSTYQAEQQQQELRRMDEQHVTLIQRLEQRVQRLDERQRRLDRQTQRLSGWRRAREEEQRLLQEELGKLELLERQQRERQQ